MKISPTDLKAAAAHLQSAIRSQGAKAETTRIRQRKTGLYALSTVNGIAVETLMPKGTIEWATIARQLIAMATEAGGVAHVM